MPFLTRSTGLSLLVALCSGPLLAQENEAEAIRKQIAEIESKLADARVASLGELTVNGRTIPADEVRREAIYLIGAKEIEARISDFFIEEQKQIAIEEGRDPSEFVVADSQIESDVAGLLTEFTKKNPDVSLWDAVRVQFGMDKARYMHMRKQTILFDRVFFPGPATEWPVVTQEAIMASAQGGDGKAFWENLVKASIDDKGNARELPPFWLQLCRGWVQKQLKSWSDIRYPSDGLPPEICLKVNEQTWSTEDAFEHVRRGLYAQDVERAIAEVTIREALRQELDKAGAYLSNDEFRQLFDEYRQQYDSTPFTTEVIAVNFKGYPSLEAFRQRWRLMRSFEKMIENEITDAALEEHAEKYKAFFGNGQVVVDVIQFLGRSQKTGGWLPNGVEDARKRAERAMKAIENGTDFDQILAQRGEYYANDEEKGRLGSKSMNQLRQVLRENEFLDLLTGFSVGDYLFFEAEPRQVYGPLRGPDSYFIARVNARIPPRGAVTIANE
ncbi:MAG: hypothetical protein KDB80_04665, partial [Planctomycetes bacterium]|nr:hypothetical protein [Planctomycetota bacterium]